MLVGTAGSKDIGPSNAGLHPVVKGPSRGRRAPKERMERAETVERAEKGEGVKSRIFDGRPLRLRFFLDFSMVFSG